MSETRNSTNNHNRRTWEYECGKLLESWETRGIHHEIRPSVPFTELWERTFPVTSEMTVGVPEYNDGFLWHRFSFEVLPHETGDAAMKKFDETEKSALVLFHHNQEEGMLLTGCEGLLSADVMVLRKVMPFLKSDLYFMPTDQPDGMHWTFVVTHEPDLGPYFCQESGKSTGKSLQIR